MLRFLVAAALVAAAAAVPPVVLIHGLGGHALTLWPLEMYLRLWCGRTAVYRAHYDPNNQSLDGSIDAVDAYMVSRGLARGDPVVLVGQSYGGIVANRLHERGWDVRQAIYIVAPMRGPRILARIMRALPGWLARWAHRPVYDELENRAPERVPPHPYHTIGTAYPLLRFDGRVFADETAIDRRHHTHIPWSSHSAIFFDWRMFATVRDILRKPPRHKL